MVNGVSMDNVDHSYAVQQLRKSGKNAKIVSLETLFTESSKMLQRILKFHIFLHLKKCFPL